MAKIARAIDLEPIARLEEKVKVLVELIEKLRSGYQVAHEENGRLKIEIEGLRSRLGDVEHAHAELVALREERDAIRARVETILGQLEEIGA